MCDRTKQHAKGRHLLLPALAILFALWTWAHLAHASTCPVSKKSPQLLMVTLYTYGLQTGRTRVNFQDRSISHLGRFRVGSECPWALLRSIATPEEAEAVCRLLKDMRSFRPKAAWFDAYNTQKYGVRDSGSDLVLTWADGTVGFRLPPSAVCSRLSKDANTRYSNLRQAARRLLDMKDAHVKSGSLSPIFDWHSSSAMKQMYAEMDRIEKVTLPEERKGW